MLVFLGESGRHDMDPEAFREQVPIFAQAACMFEPQHYKEQVAPLVGDLKAQYSGQGDPAEDPEGRAHYYEDLAGVISESKFTIVAGSIDKVKQWERYGGPQNPYELTLTFIMERLVLLLAQSDHTCRLITQSRGEEPDRELRAVYDRLVTDGTEHLRAIAFEKLIGRPEFVPGTAGETGLYFADLVAAATARKTLGEKKSDTVHWDFLAEKFCRSHVGMIPGYGFMMFPS